MNYQAVFYEQRRGNSNNRRGKFHSNKNYLNNAFQQ